MIVSPPNVLRNMYKQCVWRMAPSGKKVYLTFDDGPIPGLTEWIAEYLGKYNIKATFFCVGDNVVKNPSIYKHLQHAGHALGNHTHNHLKGFYTPNETYFENVERCNEVMQTNLFRPPYGQLKFSQERILAKKYKLVMWDILSYDYSSSITPEKCVENAVSKTRPGSIIVFHDNIKAEKNVTYALPKTIEQLVDKGFEFDKIVL
ncbi:MAG TPA: polysaccharide deacetylase family protein [Bacteroidia bacterium]